MPSTPEQTVFEADGEVFLRLCTDVTVYWRGSMFDRVDGLLHFYREAMEVVGSRITFYETEAMSGAKPIKADSLELFPSWLTKPKARRSMFILNLESSDRANEPSDAGFFVTVDEEDDVKFGAARVILPFELDKPQELVDLTKVLVDRLQFESGHAGYAVNWNPVGDNDGEAKREMAILAKRLPGLDLNNLDVTTVALQLSPEPAIKCVNWLTLIGSDLREQLPDDAELTEELGPECPIHVVPTGLIIQAGPRPELGAGRNRRLLAPYQKVGALLADHRVQDHKRIFADSVAGEDATADWLARFDG